MDSNWFSSWIILFFMFLSTWSTTHVHCRSTIFMVTDHGAIPDRVIDNKQKFLAAWARACQTNGGTLVVPAGAFLLSGAVQFSGPCNGQTKFLINGTLTASSEPKLAQDYWINFNNVNGLLVQGSGRFDGNGASVWGKCNNCGLPPVSIKLSYATNVLIQDISLVNSKAFHVSMDSCQQVTLNHVLISSPYNSPNTDGIHIRRSNYVRIRNSRIATGDDCVSIGDGSTNINITYVYCGPGHGISIGSLGRYQGEKDVSYITVSNCTLDNTQNGLRIKTYAPSTPSTVSTVTYQHIIMKNVMNPVIIDQHYCPHNNCRKGGESSVGIKGVKFIDVHGTSATPVGVNIQCSRKTPCQDVKISGIKLTFNGRPTTASCSNAGNIFQGRYQIPSKCQ